MSRKLSKKRMLKDIQSDTDSDDGPPRKKARRTADEEQKQMFDFKVTNHESIVVVAMDRSKIKGSSKIAAFDMDSTLVVPKSGKFSNGRTDWKWWHQSVPYKLKRLAADSYQIVIFTNQNGIKLGKVSQESVSGKIMDLAEELGIPLIALLATDKDHWRKPNVTMWQYFEAELNNGVGIDYAASFYVGDAAGRPKAWNGDKKTKKVWCTVLNLQ